MQLQVQCEPKIFGPDDPKLYEFVRKHSASKQLYYADHNVTEKDFKGEIYA